MNDRQRLEAIVAVVCRYLPPDGISKEDAMREIIQLVDPLPEQDTRKEWVGLTSEELATIVVEHAGFPTKQAQAINEKLKEKNA